MNIAIKDTLWINPTSYNLAYNACDYFYGDFYPDLGISNPEMISVIKLDSYFALVGKKAGTTKVRFFGEISLRRNGEDILIKEYITVNKKSIFPEPDTLRPETATKPTFAIDDILIEKGRSDNWLRLKIEKTPELVNEARDWGDMNYIFSNSFHPDSAQTSTFEDDQGYDSFSFEMDSAYSHIIGMLNIGNNSSWDPEKEENIPGINKSTGRTFYIRSYPKEAPVSDRTFELVIKN